MLNYTTEDLLEYLYQDISEEKSLAIEKALQKDWILREKFNALKRSMLRLNAMVASPRPQSVAAILNYAKASAVLEQS